MSDQVPELRYAQLPSSLGVVGTAATADPVSWEAGATTSIPPNPVWRDTESSNAPTRVPGGTICAKIFVGRLKRLSSLRDQSCFAGSKNWVVVASVNSAARTPERHQ